MSKRQAERWREHQGEGLGRATLSRRPDQATLSRRQLLRLATGAGCACAAGGLGLLAAGNGAGRLAQAQDVAGGGPGSGARAGGAGGGPGFDADGWGGLEGDAGHVFRPSPAKHFERLAERRVRCLLCPRKCEVADMERGTCGVRENRGGSYYTLVHSRAVSVHIDPIEKKPFFHVLPGSLSFSLATAGCNIECKFCQNWQISQFRPEQVHARFLPPREVQALARRSGSQTIAYTYSEPVVFYEYMLDIATTPGGIRSVMVSNGYIQDQPLRELLPHLAAVKIDLKAFREPFYRDTCRGELKPVLQTINTVRKLGKWLELVVLLVPTLNDSPAEIGDLCRFVKSNLGPDVPLHFTRFHPTYRMKNLPPTPVASLERAHQIGKSEGLRFVYTGNLPGHPGESTLCPSCGRLLIRRIGFQVLENQLRDGRCGGCGVPIPGVWA